MFKGGLLTRLRNGDLAYIVTILIMVILPLHYKYLPPLMIMLGLCWISEHFSAFGELFRCGSPRYRSLLIAFLIFYLWQIAGLLYTDDLRMGLSNVFGRLSILVFPLIFFKPAEKIRVNILKLLRVFALSTSVYTLTCFGYALYRSLSYHGGIWIFNPHPPEAEWLNYFFGLDLTYSIHPSYLSMFVLISVFISFESWFDLTLKTIFRFGWCILGLFLLSSIYFISSRAAILAGLVMIIFYVFNNIIHNRRSLFILTSLIVIMILLLLLVRKNYRVDALLSRFSTEKTINLRDQDDRIIIWESALKVAGKNLFFGVGIGDVRTELVNEYFKSGEEKLGRERLNAHNQFLEVFLEGGIIGFTIFLYILGFMIFTAINEKNLLYGLFIIMMFVFFMFETILYRLAGIAFFSLFSFLLLQLPQNKLSPDNSPKHV
jgi:O-antigen ligase